MPIVGMFSSCIFRISTISTSDEHTTRPEIKNLNQSFSNTVEHQVDIDLTPCSSFIYT